MMKPYYPHLLKLLPDDGKLVEIGVGDAEFLAYVAINTRLEISGYDIHEHAGIDKNRSERVKKTLNRCGLPNHTVSWVSADDAMPYPNESVDMIISLQTLEHVKDIKFLFSEIHRVLRTGGRALHYFPSREIMVDPHSGLPFVHRLTDHRRFLMSRFSQIGLGKYRGYKKERGYTLDHFCDEFDHYIRNYCHFRCRRDYLSLSDNNGLEASFLPLPPFPKVSWLATLLSFFTSICLQQTKSQEIQEIIQG